MEITIKYSLMKSGLKDFKECLGISDYYEKKLLLPIGSDEGYSAEDVASYDLVEMSDTKLKSLLLALEKNNAPKKTIETVKRWIAVLKDPANGEVSSTKGMEKVFGKLIKGLQNNWLLYKGGDGELNPVLVRSTKHVYGSREDAAHLEIKFSYGYLFPKSEDEEKGYCSLNETISVYKSDIVGEEIDVPYASSADDDDEDDEEDEGAQKKKPKKKSARLSEILSKHDLFIPSKDELKKYEELMVLQKKTAAQIGTQFTVSGKGYNIEGSNYSGLRTSLVSMSEDDIPNKVVVDTVASDDEVVKGVDTDFGKGQPLPYHPYVRVYDITKFRNVGVHVSKMTKYVYNPALIDSLILPQSHKALLNALIAGEATFNDIIAGKSGGIIILGSGISGTGKTLTGEVYSEVVGKPLYQVQSSQLGLNPEELEKRLYKILRRADKWGAVLMIDECDPYVYQRGEDIVQNSIVGVFLRLLEYYKGILFLTTNRHDKIDQAIMSRLTAHIRYGVPSREDQIKIFEVICKGYSIKVQQAEIEKILTKYPNMVGRDIRNLLKLLKKFNHKEKKDLILKAEMLTAVEEFIPFVNDSKDAGSEMTLAAYEKMLGQIAGIFFDLNYDEERLMLFLRKEKYGDLFIKQIQNAYKNILKYGKQ